MRSDIVNPNLIIRNSLYLFVRLLFVMAIAFYTTRLTLQILGDIDYGINNIIGGVISMFAIISMPVTGALQRFFNVEFTKQELPGNVIFSSSIRIIAMLALGMTILYETIGLYIINYILNYPPERTFAVNIIFQLTVATTICSFFTLSYSTLLFAKEEMGIPATIEIVSSVIKLVMLLLIPYVSLDVLICYSVIVLLISIFQFVFFFVYCNSKYEESRLTRQVNKDLQKDILKFAGWSSINAVAGISLTYLSNIFINVFGGVIYNTAYGISQQLSNAVGSFSTNLMRAVDPQITSSTVTDLDIYRNKIMLSSIKYSLLGVGFFYIIFVAYGHFLLKIWLGHVPNYAFDFCIISLLNILFTSIILPLRTIILATGQIKGLFVDYGVMALVANVIMFFSLLAGFPVIIVMYVILLVGIASFVDAARIVVNLTSIQWLPIVLAIGKVFCCLLVGLTLMLVMKTWYKETFLSVIFVVFVTFLVVMILSLSLVMTCEEKKYCLKLFYKLYAKCNY